MKTYTILLFVVTTVIGFQVQAQEKKDKDSYTIHVEGLGCPFCAYGLEKKFKEFKAIKNITIDMETGVFTFSYPAVTPLTLHQVATQVEKAGYTPERIEIKRYNGVVETNDK